jgi:DNA primase large subunit
MKRLHVNLRSEHHLKHQARQQYGLFLKGAGLSLEEALVFWKSEFTKKMDADKVKIL